MEGKAGLGVVKQPAKHGLFESHGERRGTLAYAAAVQTILGARRSSGILESASHQTALETVLRVIHMADVAIGCSECGACAINGLIDHIQPCRRTSVMYGLNGESQRALSALAAAAETVNHPAHYNSHPSGIECISIIEHMTLNIGNAVKCLWRAGLKDDAPTDEDYAKAIWYIERERERLKGTT